MVFEIIHTTRYKYENGASFCHNLATLKPKNGLGQELLEYKLNISPMPNEFSERVDFFGNTIARFSVQQYHEELEVTAKSKVYRNYEDQEVISNLNKCKSVTVKQAKELLKSLDDEVLNARQFLLKSPLISVDSEEIGA